MGVRPEKLPSALEGVFLMGRKPKYSIEEKIKAVEDVLIRKKSKNSVVKGLGTSLGVNMLNYWIAQYKADGPDGLRTHQRNNQYTEEDRMTVFEYIRAGKSVSEVSRMLLIPATVIRNWVKCYNNPTKVGSSMAGKGGKGVPKQYHDFDTMLKATEECIKSGHDYKSVCRKYSIKYSALYSWVRKYEAEGESGLVRKSPGRSKAATDQELTENERLKAQLATKEQEIRELRESLEILKKKERISLLLATGQIKSGN